MPIVPANAVIDRFNDPGFAPTWARTAAPIENQPNVGRGYTWGPLVKPGRYVWYEYYNGKMRTVQYFDKARMEVNDPKADSNSLYYVSTGLLVKELVTGNRQYGDSEFMAFASSNVQVAGDPNQDGANSNAPTYTSFKKVGTFSGNENGKTTAPGSTINAGIDKAGNVSTLTPPEQLIIGGYDGVTQHNIADVFVKFGKQSGLIWNGKEYVQGEVFFGNPTYVLGRPVTEPYWTRAAVGGVEKDVLVQLFERRVLTYTPSNPAASKVEMGNVGQHYYRWRYQEDNNLQVQFVSEFGKDYEGLKSPITVAVDSQGNNYVISYSFARIHKYDSNGNFLTKWGDYGNGDGQFNNPVGIVVDRQNNVFVVEKDGRRVQKFDSNGKFLLKWGNNGSERQFSEPNALALDNQGNVYVSDYTTSSVQKFDGNGKLLAKWNVNNEDKQGSPRGLAVDSQGNIYVTYIYYPKAGTVTFIRKFDREGRYLAKWDYEVSSIALDAQDNIYTTPNYSNKIVKYDTAGRQLAQLIITENDSNKGIYLSNITIANLAGGVVNIYAVGSDERVVKLDSQGKLLASWGNYGRGDGFLRSPSRLVVDAQGNLYVGDNDNHRIQKFDSNGKFLLKWGTEGRGNGQFDYVSGVAIDKQDNVYTTDFFCGCVQKFDNNGKFLAKWTTETSGGGKFEGVKGITVDSLGNVYVANFSGNVVDKFNSQGRFLTSLIGRATDDKFLEPSSVTVDAQDNLYVVEDKGSRIMKFDSNGKFLARFSQYGEGDGEIKFPQDIALDNQGNMYVADYSNERVVKFDSAGRFVYSWGHEGKAKGQLAFPKGVALDNQGNLYVADYSNDRVQKFRVK